MAHRRGGREVLRVDALEVAPGERIGLLGPNGAGKSSLLRLAAALEPPTTGDVRIQGVSTRGAGAPLRRRVGYAPQHPILLAGDARANVALPLRYRGLGRAARRAAAEAALGRMGVGHLASRPARALSGGEAQRVSLARALAPDPRLLLLDEPAASLDGPTRTAFLDDLARVLEDRTTAVIHVSHRPEDLLALADRLVILIDGAVRQVGTPAALLAAPADPAVAALLGYENVLPGDGRDNGRPPLAVWAAGVGIRPPGAAPLRATVRRVAVGPGRLEVVCTLESGESVVAHLPLGDAPPTAGARVSLALDPARTARLGR